MRQSEELFEEAELRRLAPGRIVVLGGVNAVSDAVAAVDSAAARKTEIASAWPVSSSHTDMQ